MGEKTLPRDMKLIPRSRDLRNHATKQENHLWYGYLKKQKLHFYRQRIIGEYIVDFYCPAMKLVIEIDGAQHYEDDALEYDSQRTEYLKSLGLTVKRFTNIDIDRNFVGVCMVLDEEILSHLRMALQARPLQLPKPPNGGRLCKRDPLEGRRHFGCIQLYGCR